MLHSFFIYGARYCNRSHALVINHAGFDVSFVLSALFCTNRQHFFALTLNGCIIDTQC